MTVHMAQGSEFDTVWLLLPARPNRVLSRELDYTGITRVRHPALPLGSQERAKDAVGRRLGEIEGGHFDCAARDMPPEESSMLCFGNLIIPKKGIIMPNMGTKQKQRVSEAAALYASTSLSDALFTATQRRVLARLFGQPGRSQTVSELIHATGAGSGAVQREVARLAGSGLLTVDQVGNQKRYRANPDSPIHDELAAIVRKTFGLAEPLREALAPLAAHIQAAFIYGSVAKGGDTAGSDIDLLLVADEITYADAMGALHPLAEALGRNVNPTLYTRAELRKRIEAGNSFVSRVLEQPRIWLIGDEHGLAA